MSTTARENISETFITGKVRIIVPRETRNGNTFFQIAAETDEAGIVRFDLWKDEDTRAPRIDETFTALIQHERVTNLTNGKTFDNHRAVMLAID